MTSVDLLNKIESNNGSYTTTSKKKVCELDTDVKALKEQISDLKKNVKSLKNYSSESTIKSKVERNLKKIVKSYNELKKNSGKIADEELNKQLSKLDDLFSDNEKELKKIGLKKEDGKLKFDSDIFEDAEKEDIDKLFVGKKSFIRQLDKIMNTVSERADDAEYSTVERKVSKITHYSEDDRLLANAFAVTDGVVQVMNSYSKLMYEGTLDSSDKDGIEGILSEEELKKDLQLFSQYAYQNKWISLDKSGSQEKIKELCEKYEEDLKKVGITFNENGDMEFSDITIDGNGTTDSDDTTIKDNFKEAFISLFGTNAEFGKEIQNYCKDGFNKIIDPEKLGVSIIDSYV